MYANPYTEKNNILAGTIKMHLKSGFHYILKIAANVAHREDSQCFFPQNPAFSHSAQRHVMFLIQPNLRWLSKYGSSFKELLQ
jgi:hypothetical protein